MVCWAVRIYDQVCTKGVNESSMPSRLFCQIDNRYRNGSYYVIEGGGDLYKRGFTTPLLKGLTRDQVKYMMNEMHRGIFWMHLGSWSMTTRVLSVGYYRPTIRRDYTKYMKKCQECWRFGNISHQLDEELHNIVASWSFSTCEVNILGPPPPPPLHTHKSKVSSSWHGSFHKWIEAEPITIILVANVQKFIWKNIVCQFKIPNNGK